MKHILRKTLFFVTLALINIFVVPTAFAVTLSLESFPSSIDDQPFEITVSLYGAGVGQNYLRVDLFKEGTSNYFGETYNGTDWYSGSDGKRYFPITISSSSTTVSATFQARLGSPSSSEYSGEGNYKIKVRRYTSSGARDDDIVPGDIMITYALPTATPTPTIPNPTATRTPTPTKAPTPTKTPTPPVSKAESEQSVHSLKSDTQEEDKDKINDYPTSVLGTGDDEDTSPSVTPVKVTVKGSSQSLPVVTLVLCTVGGISLLSCGILIFLKRRKGEL